MTISAPTQAGDKPVCAEPGNRAWLDHVQAAKGKNAPRLRAAFYEACCDHCPVIDSCAAFAGENGEHGLWGGTSERQRRAQGHRRPYTHNLREIHVGGSEFTKARAKRHDTAAVRAWARDAGIDVSPKGIPKREVFDAYDAAHAVGAA